MLLGGPDPMLAEAFALPGCCGSSDVVSVLSVAQGVSQGQQELREHAFFADVRRQQLNLLLLLCCWVMTGGVVVGSWTGARWSGWRRSPSSSRPPRPLTASLRSSYRRAPRRCAALSSRSKPEA